MNYSSYVYIAFGTDEDVKTWVKIGQTTDPWSRNRQLNGFRIIDAVNVGGDSALRLFIESYLRLKLASAPFTTRVKDDYFICQEKTQVDFLITQFQSYVQEAIQISKNISIKI